MTTEVSCSILPLETIIPDIADGDEKYSITSMLPFYWDA